MRAALLPQVAILRKDRALSFRNEKPGAAMSQQGRFGNYATHTFSGQPYKAFVPPPLPPNPSLQLRDKHVDLMERANRALGRLDGAISVLPDTSLFLHFYLRKEALFSSQIEGTQASFSDLLLFENKEPPNVPVEDIKEVSSYIAAMEYGLARIRRDFSLSLRLLKEMHSVLLSKGRSTDKAPGQFRRGQVWVGGTGPSDARFVPPPQDRVVDLMGDLEKFLLDRPTRTPLLIKAALAHAQFETIHPFSEGNGRIGRLLITLLLCTDGALSEPVFYLSRYLKTHRDTYYDLLQRVRTDGAWEVWLEFFLTGVLETAEHAAISTKTILRLFEKDRTKIEALGRPAGSALRVYEFMQSKPVISVPMAAKALDVTEPTVRASLAHLEKLHIVKETTGRQRNRLFVYDKYLGVLEEGAKPLQS
jgi:Fic family protein